MEINVKKKAAPTRGGPQQPVLAPWGASQPQHAKLQLSRSFGVGVVTPNGMLCHPVSPELLAYTCGCVAVLYNASTRQQRFFKSRAADKVLACLAFTEDGTHIAAGERGGSSPDVQIWEVASGRILTPLRSHKYGIGALAFGGDGKLLSSAGLAYDGQVCLWDWASSTLLCRHYTQAEVHSLSFVDDSTAIAAVGKEYFKVLSLSYPAGKARAATGGGATLTARPASLKDFRAATFVAIMPVPAAAAAAAAAAVGVPAVAVVPGRSTEVSTGPQSEGSSQALYALTSNGVLLLMRPSGRTIDKSVSLQVPTAFGLSTSQTHVACACASGVVRLFHHTTLAFQFNLPRPGGRAVAGGKAAAAAKQNGPGATSSSTSTDLFPDALACSFGCSGKQLSVVYSDRSLVMWDVRSSSKVCRLRCLQSHTAGIWDAALIPSWQAAYLGHSSGAKRASVDLSASASSPLGVAAAGAAAPSLQSVVATCGADGSILLWSAGVPTADAAVRAGAAAGVAVVGGGVNTKGRLPPPGVSSGSVLRAVLLASPSDSGVTALAARPVNGIAGRVAAAVSAAPCLLRCLCISPDGRHLAVGDQNGNLRIYDLQAMELLLFREAHDAEVLSLSYSPVDGQGRCLLASASRDMLVHVYDAQRNYELLQTCEEHGGAVTAVRFSPCGRRLLSCGADRSIIFRNVSVSFPAGPHPSTASPKRPTAVTATRGNQSPSIKLGVYCKQTVPKGALFDLALDVCGHIAVTVGADGLLRTWDVVTGAAGRVTAVAQDGLTGDVTRVTLDAQGGLAICPASDGSIRIYDLEAGTLLARGSGHGEMATSTLLMDSCSEVLSTGGDGVAFLWRLPPALALRCQEGSLKVAPVIAAQVAAAGRARDIADAASNAVMGVIRQALEINMRKGAVGAAAVSNGAVASTPAAARVQPGMTESMWGVPRPTPQAVSTQSSVAMSATLLRVRGGNPLMSLEKLPKWAQQAHMQQEDEQPMSEDGQSETEEEPKPSDTPGDVQGIHKAAVVNAIATVAATVAKMSPPKTRPAAEIATAAAAAAAAGSNATAPLTSHHTAKSGSLTSQGVTSADITQRLFVAPAATIPAPAISATLPHAYTVGGVKKGESEDARIAVKNAAAPVEAGLQSLSRPWADGLEDDDDIQFEQMADAEEGLALDELHGAGGYSAQPQAGSNDDGSGEDSPSRAESSSPTSAGVDKEIKQPTPDSDAGSNRMDISPAPAPDNNNNNNSAPEEEEEHGVARDLFRQHFDTLEQSSRSATPTSQQDPRRQSLSRLYLQGKGEHAVYPILPTTPPPLLAHTNNSIITNVDTALPSTPPPPSLNAAHLHPLAGTPYLATPAPGCAAAADVAAHEEEDGGVVSRVRNQRVAVVDLDSIPLNSPRLRGAAAPVGERTETQLTALQLLKERLQNTLMKNKDAAAARLATPAKPAAQLAGPSAAAAIAAAAAATAAAPVAVAAPPPPAQIPAPTFKVTHTPAVAAAAAAGAVQTTEPSTPPLFLGVATAKPPPAATAVVAAAPAVAAAAAVPAAAVAASIKSASVSTIASASATATAAVPTTAGAPPVITATAGAPPVITATAGAPPVITATSRTAAVPLPVPVPSTHQAPASPVHATTPVQTAVQPIPHLVSNPMYNTTPGFSTIGSSGSSSSIIANMGLQAQQQQPQPPSSTAHAGPTDATPTPKPSAPQAPLLTAAPPPTLTTSAEAATTALAVPPQATKATVKTSDVSGTPCSAAASGAASLHAPLLVHVYAASPSFGFTTQHHPATSTHDNQTKATDTAAQPSVVSAAAPDPLESHGLLSDGGRPVSITALPLSKSSHQTSKASSSCSGNTTVAVSEGVGASTGSTNMQDTGIAAAATSPSVLPPVFALALQPAAATTVAAAAGAVSAAVTAAAAAAVAQGSATTVPASFVPTRLKFVLPSFKPRAVPSPTKLHDTSVLISDQASSEPIAPASLVKASASAAPPTLSPAGVLHNLHASITDVGSVWRELAANATHAMSDVAASGDIANALSAEEAKASFAKNIREALSALLLAIQ